MRLLLIALVAIIPCLPKPGSTQVSCGGTSSMDATNCASGQWQRADAELNQLWSRLKPQADADGTGSVLLGQQRQWLRRRDKTCEQELGHGGSLDQAIYYNCMRDMTLQRSADFSAMLR